MKIVLEVETDRDSGFSPHDLTVQDPSGWEIEFHAKVEHRGLEWMEMLQYGIAIAGNIGLNIVASWIYDKLKGKATKLWINGNEVEMQNKEEDTVAQIQIFLRQHQH